MSQYLSLQEQAHVGLLFQKHAIETPPDEDDWGIRRDTLLRLIRGWLEGAQVESIEAMLSEVARTQGSFRNRVTPRYVYDERWRDLCICLQLDGYILGDGELVRAEPNLEGAVALEDDLTRELDRAGLPEAADVRRAIENSAEEFRRANPDLNGALTNARVALQALATAISRTKMASRPPGFDETKWGQVAAHLRTSGVISPEEEKGLVGVFTFVSPGAHTTIGLAENEMARIGRTLVIGMCYFLIKRHNG